MQAVREFIDHGLVDAKESFLFGNAISQCSWIELSRLEGVGFCLVSRASNKAIEFFIQKVAHFVGLAYLDGRLAYEVQAHYGPTAFDYYQQAKRLPLYLISTAASVAIFVLIGISASQASYAAITMMALDSVSFIARAFLSAEGKAEIHKRTNNVALCCIVGGALTLGYPSIGLLPSGMTFVEGAMCPFLGAYFREAFLCMPYIDPYMGEALRRFPYLEKLCWLCGLYISMQIDLYDPEFFVNGIPSTYQAAMLYCSVSAIAWGINSVWSHVFHN